MDILLLKITTNLGLIFAPIFICGVVTIFTCIHSREKDNVKVAESIKNTLIMFVAFYIALSSIAPFALHKAVEQKFYSLGAQDKMLIQKAGSIVEIQNKAAISEFINIVRKSKEVPAHHSHPINPINFYFPGIGYYYAISQDSQNKNEFWVHWNRYPGRKQDWDAEVKVKQFHSEEINCW